MLGLVVAHDCSYFTLDAPRRSSARPDRCLYSKRQSRCCCSIVTRIVSAVENLASYPSMGRPGRIKGTREYAFADIPYVIAHRLQSGVVEIVTVIHGAQKWPLELD
jgi:hypothetical protein